MKKLLLVFVLFVGSLTLNSCTDPSDELDNQDLTEQGYGHDEVGDDNDTTQQETGNE